MIYAGIGSRRTPPEACEKLTEIAAYLSKHDGWLRSGGADGADKAFELGAGTYCDILRPKDATLISLEYAEKLHPAWHMCNDYARRLHGRNIQIILGRKLDRPADFVLAWTDTPDSGGTRMGLECAKQNNIPVFNLWVENEEQRFWDWFNDWHKGNAS